MNHPEAVGRLPLNAHPVAHARQLVGQVMTVEIPAGQFRPERAGLIHEQQLISVDCSNAGERIRRPALRPLLEPIAPTQFIQFTVPIAHHSPLIVYRITICCCA